MSEVSTRLEFEIMEAFQKTDAYKTVTKGLDVFAHFRAGYLAHALRPIEVGANPGDKHPSAASGKTPCPVLEGSSLPLMGFR